MTEITGPETAADMYVRSVWPPAPGDQPPPTHRPGEVSVHEFVAHWLRADPVKPTSPLVADDLMERAAVGIKRYGTLLQPGNGRDALWDAYQEALDALAYVAQAYLEADRVGDVLEAGLRYVVMCSAAMLCDRLRRAIDRQDSGG